MIVYPEIIKYSMYIEFDDTSLSKKVSEIAINAGFTGYLCKKDMFGTILICENNDSCWYPHFANKEELKKSCFGGEKYITPKEFLRLFSK